jgi:hypothetical protein
MKIPQAIGLDFDNTLVSYDRLLARLVKELGWACDLTGKRAIRDAVRASSLGDLGWQRLQGMIYGHRMPEAEITSGVQSFLQACQQSGTTVKIISHKTEFAGVDPTHTPLREAALKWMTDRGFFGRFGISVENVFFTATKAEKIAHIGKVAVSIFIDDLEEILGDPEFPETVERILFSPEGEVPMGPYRMFRNFDDIRVEIFGA